MAFINSSGLFWLNADLGYPLVFTCDSRNAPLAPPLLVGSSGAELGLTNRQVLLTSHAEVTHSLVLMFTVSIISLYTSKHF